MVFYFNPLNKALREVRDELLKMNSEGVLRCKYIIEQNEVLMGLVVVMV